MGCPVIISQPHFLRPPSIGGPRETLQYYSTILTIGWPDRAL